MDPIFISSAIVILIFSIVIHEVMHGFIALKFGDRTAEKSGRLTLNPLPHIDPVGSVLLPLILIGLPLISGAPVRFFIAWAKPVPVNPLNFSDMKKGELFVSAAGILSNFSMAIIATILFHVLAPILGFSNIIIHLLSFTTTINLILGFFNLLPIPPLDGSRILTSQLPYNLAREYERIAPYGVFIILALLWLTPIFAIILGGLLGLYSSIFSIPLRLF